MKKNQSSQSSDAELAELKSLYQELRRQISELGASVRARRTKLKLAQLHESAESIGKTSAQIKKLIRRLPRRKKS